MPFFKTAATGGCPQIYVLQFGCYRMKHNQW